MLYFFTCIFSSSRAGKVCEVKRAELKRGPFDLATKLQTLINTDSTDYLLAGYDNLYLRQNVGEAIFLTSRLRHTIDSDESLEQIYLVAYSCSSRDKECRRIEQEPKIIECIHKLTKVTNSY